jgi:hypothetical protein
MRVALRLAVMTGFLTAASACDLTVSNPGPVADQALDDVAAHQALVNGMARALSRALGYLAYTSAVASKEVVSAGHRNPAQLGITPKQAIGILAPELEESNDHWRFAQQARWVAEDGVRRMRESLGSDFERSALAAQALLHAGFSNRLLGENMCDAVFDGGPIEPRIKYFERAEAAFTEAATIAGAAASAPLANAAFAGRASVRIWLGNWSGAVADAETVPSSFVYRALYSSTEIEMYNRIFAANATTARAHSVVGTLFEGYFKATADKRTPWSTDPAFPKGSADVLWYFQTKFTSRSAPVNLATGREMRLVRAEALLRAGDWQGALSALNALRIETAVPTVTASGISETWTMLGRERSIELWLEGRRLGDLFRFKRDGVPGNFEDMTGRDTCFPIGVSEIDANPNF